VSEADTDETLEAFAARHAPDALLVVDSTGTLVYASPSAQAITGFEPASQMGTSIFDKVHPDDLGYAAGALQETVRKDGLHIPVHLRITHADGGWRDVEVTANTPVAESGEPMIVLSLRPLDVRLVLPQRRRQLEALIERVSGSCAGASWQAIEDIVGVALAEIGAFFSAARVVVRLADPDDGLMHPYSEWRAPGRSPGDDDVATHLTATEPGWDTTGSGRAFFAGPTLDAVDESTARVLRQVGAVAMLSCPVLSDGVLVGAVHLLWDENADPYWDDALGEDAAGLASILTATAQRAQAEAAVYFRSLHDPLTGVANRTELLDGLRRAMSGLTRDAPIGGVGLLYCDVDDFKSVNDRFGHAVGDRVLIDIVNRIRSQIRPGDLIGRVGGDEFVVLCERLYGHQGAVEIAERIRTSIASSAPQGLPPDARLGLSVGIAFTAIPRHPDELMAEADQQMYDRKAAARH